MKIIVTGGAGFIESAIIRHYEKHQRKRLVLRK